MQPAPPVPGASADFGSRFSAFMIDLVLLFVVQWVVVLVAARQLQAVGLNTTEPCAEGSLALCDGPSNAVWVLLLLFLLFSTVGYHAIFEGQWGATPGKRWVGLEVVSDSGSSPIGLSAGILRSIVRQIFWLALFFVFDASPLSVAPPAGLFLLLVLVAMAPMVVSAFLPDGLAVHDRVARTQVVRSNQHATRTKRVPAPSPPPPSTDEPEPVAALEDSEEAL